MYSGIIWDFDGTLFNTYPGMVKAFQKALKNLGVEEETDIIFSKMKISVGYAVSYFKDLYNLDDKELTALYKFYESKNNEEDAKPFPYAKEFCKKYKEHGGKNYIFTHRDESTQRYLKYYDMIDFFDDIVTSSSGFKKPGPEGFLYFVDKYNLKKEGLLVLGDRDIEVIGAQRAGLHSCLYNTGGVDWNVKPHYTINSLKDLFEIFNIPD